MRRLPIVVGAVVACVAGFGIRSAQAWDNEGHMMVAAIAYKQLPATTRQELIAILRGNDKLYQMLVHGLPAGLSAEDRDTYTLMRAATWPDMVRSTSAEMHDQHRAHWHYINLPVAFDGRSVTEPSTQWKTGEEADNILQAIAKCEADLKDKALSADERAIRLCWLLHLIGDIHQPLHAVALFSPHYGKGDEGGNREWVNDGNRALKLHAFWDDLPGISNDPKEATIAADKLLKTKKLERGELKDELKQTEPLQWAQESKKIAEEQVYLGGQFPPKDAEATQAQPAALSSGYVAKAHEIADKRLALAGYRLADHLVALLAPPPLLPVSEPVTVPAH
jgi:hypothetical protein